MTDIPDMSTQDQRSRDFKGFLVTETANCLAENITDKKAIALVTTGGWGVAISKTQLEDLVKKYDGEAAYWMEVGMGEATLCTALDIGVRLWKERQDSGYYND